MADDVDLWVDLLVQLDGGTARAAEHRAAVLHRGALQHDDDDDDDCKAGDDDDDDDEDENENWAEVRHHGALQHRDDDDDDCDDCSEKTLIWLFSRASRLSLTRGKIGMIRPNTCWKS